MKNQNVIGNNQCLILEESQENEEWYFFNKYFGAIIMSVIDFKERKMRHLKSLKTGETMTVSGLKKNEKSKTIVKGCQANNCSYWRSQASGNCALDDIMIGTSAECMNFVPKKAVEDFDDNNSAS